MSQDQQPIVLFHPHIPEGGISALSRTLQTRWIGQGPQVEEFERRFSERFCRGAPAVAVSSGTSALHLAYLLAGIAEGDEVITPVFTCTATNIPLLYERAVPVFADIQPDTLNIDPASVRALITERTRAIVCVHYGGFPCDMQELHAIARERGIPVIEDAAHALGATYGGEPVGSLSEYTVFSFQAVKHLTTGDGGMLACGARQAQLAKRLRWFGIDREAKLGSRWENDIREIGYKYQMTDIAASLGLAGLNGWEDCLALRKRLLVEYHEGLRGIPGLQLVGSVADSRREHAAWTCTVLVDGRADLQRKLREAGIESDPVHFRNDKYSVFERYRGQAPNMDAVESRYLVLPLHTRMSGDDVRRVCNVVRAGW
ncbi:DegT/DnrJ/EryC1/StrS family aminotransferase [Ramlibacter sp. PS4R-6]|uniref:DegT/DnrJ/EryC1/StrS family aminotransferase n=1 Tax=Ramlibacter sp. PS4R-6 TaxID=3133438 RepID=UPI00309892B3